MNKPSIEMLVYALVHSRDVILQCSDEYWEYLTGGFSTAIGIYIFYDITPTHRIHRVHPAKLLRFRMTRKYQPRPNVAILLTENKLSSAHKDVSYLLHPKKGRIFYY